MTRQGTDPLLPKSENVAIIIEPPTDEEVNAAITGNMGHLVTVVGASISLATFQQCRLHSVETDGELILHRCVQSSASSSCFSGEDQNA